MAGKLQLLVPPDGEISLMGNRILLMPVSHLIIQSWATGALYLLVQVCIISNEAHTSPYVSDDQGQKGKVILRTNNCSVCLLNVCSKSMVAFGRAAWRSGAVMLDNGSKYQWLVIITTLGFRAQK